MTVRRKFDKYCRLYTEIAAYLYLRKNRDLNNLISEVNKESDSIGLSNFEYVRLYKMVRNIKPEYVLECGTGKSTFIIAHAMSKNGNGKKLVTMEESKEWAEKQKRIISHLFNHKWFPGETENLIELVHSTTIIAHYRVWTGSCYKNITDYPYTFIMVDGPRLTEKHFINLDLINILRTSNNPISMWIDGRWPIVAMCRTLFGDRVISKLGWTHTEICGATKEDVFRDKELIREEMHKMVKRL